MNKYKILIVHNFYKIPGGEDTVVWNEIEMLKANGHEVVTYFKYNNDIEAKGLFNKIKLFFQTIFSYRNYRSVKEIINRNYIDIVHVHNTLPVISPSVYYAAFSENVPVVQTLHNYRLLCPGGTFTINGKICEECVSKGLHVSLKHKCYRNSFLQTFTVYSMLKLHRLIGTYKRVNAYIALTEFNKRKFLKVINEDKIFVKPNFSVKPVNSFSGDNLEDYFVYIGRLEQIKGIHLLLEAWAKLENRTLYIIGDGVDRQKVEDAVESNSKNNIKIFGYLERDKALDIIKKARAVVIPSQCYEGFPMTIVESFSLGVPVVAGNIGNLSSIVEDGYNGLTFEYNSDADLRNKINEIAENDDLRLSLGRNAYKTFVEKYTDIINYRQLLDIYKYIKGDTDEKV